MTLKGHLVSRGYQLSALMRASAAAVLGIERVLGINHSYREPVYRSGGVLSSDAEANMLTASDFYHYARECYDFALKAGTESVRYQFLDLTKMWVTAAQELENGDSTPHSPRRQHARTIPPAIEGFLRLADDLSGNARRCHDKSPN